MLRVPVQSLPWEKPVLAGACVVFGFSFLIYMSGRSDGSNSSDVAAVLRAAAKLSEAMSAPSEVAAPNDPRPALERRLIEVPAAASALPDAETFFWRRAVTVVRPPDPPDPPRPVHSAPILASPEAVLGAVRLSWAPAPGQEARIVGWVVYRTGPDGADRRLAERPAAESAFEDATVEPEAEYRYAVTALTDDRHPDLLAAPESPRGATGAIRSAATLRLSFRNVGAGKAQVERSRFESGRWSPVEKFWAAPGDAVGDTGWTVRSLERSREGRGPWTLRLEDGAGRVRELSQEP